MAVVMTAVVPASTDMYDSIYQAMGVSPGSLPKGMVAHYAAPTDDGMLIFDVWESKEDFQAFAAEKLAPALEEVSGHAGGGIEPTVVALYNEFHR